MSVPSAARWRIRIFQNNGATFNHQVADVVWAAAAGGTSLATGGTASASSSAAGDVPANAFDGNAATKWGSASATGVNPQWLAYAFTGPVAPVELRLRSIANIGAPEFNPRAVAVEYSTDGGTTWLVHCFILGMTAWGVSEERAFSLVPPSSAQIPRARWAIYIDAVAGDAGNRVRVPELAFALVAGGANVATGGAAFSDTTPYSPASNAFDGSIATIWEQDRPDFTTYLGVRGTRFLGYVFPSAIVPTELRITSDATVARTPRDFGLAWSPDGVTWWPVPGAAWTGQTWVSGQTRAYATGLSSAMEVPETPAEFVAALPPVAGWRDPTWTETAELAALIGAGWSAAENEVRVNLRDATWWLERPADGPVYAGTGGVEGPASLAGRRKPRLRGGSAANPVREISPVLVDPVAGIYQVSDAAGGIVTLYERGQSGGIVSAGAVPDILAASPAAGTYVTESSARGLFLRLGSFPPAGVITVDAWGAFPSGAAPSTAAAVALELLRQDFAVPPGYLDAASFAALDAAAPWAAGIYIAEEAEALATVGRLLQSVSARLMPRRSGALAALRLAALGGGQIAVAAYTPAQIVSCTPRDLPAPLYPPPSRFRVGYQRFHTVQTSDLAPTLDGARVQALAEEWRIATASTPAVATAWRRPSDPPVVATALLAQADAQALADLLRDLWCVPPGRRLYDVQLPLAYALRHDIGDPIGITYPGELAAGVIGRIVGEQLRTADNLATLQVLA